MAVYEDGEWWSAAAGYSKIESGTPMEVCQLQYMQSISKTHMAVAILRLYEQQEIDLHASIEQYLPARYHRYLPDVKNITVYMLLNHTSGLPEYNFQPAYVSKLFHIRITLLPAKSIFSL
jgi:D-alanyl-D-alanine carboxypeptidase